MKSRLVLRQLKRLENQFCVSQEISDRAAKIQELLREQDELLEKLRSDPEYTVEWEMEIAEKVVREMVKDGLLSDKGSHYAADLRSGKKVRRDSEDGCSE